MDNDLKNRRLLLLGATGRTGKWVMEKALGRGYHVHCLARNSKRIQSREGLTLFEGDPLNAADLKKALATCHKVISVLNISRTSDFPWARLRTPKTYMSDVMNQLVAVARIQEIERITICSAWGVHETKKDIPKWFRWFIDNSNIGVAYKDHERQEDVLENSSLSWTIVRPVGLSNSKKREKIRETFKNQPVPSMLISRKSVADYLISSIENDSLIGKKVVISKD